MDRQLTSTTCSQCLSVRQRERGDSAALIASDKWDGAQAKNLTWYFVPGCENCTSAAVLKAANSWSDAAHGAVVFKQVNTPEAALFSVRDSEELNTRNVALSFFPNVAPPRNLICFPVMRGYTEPMKAGVIRHELGHILGFRHEHIWDKNNMEHEWPTASCSPLTRRDPNSVMDYSQIQRDLAAGKETQLSESDKAGIQRLYAPDGEIPRNLIMPLWPLPQLEDNPSLAQGSDLWVPDGWELLEKSYPFIMSPPTVIGTSTVATSDAVKVLYIVSKKDRVVIPEMTIIACQPTASIVGWAYCNGLNGTPNLCDCTLCACDSSSTQKTGLAFFMRKQGAGPVARIADIPEGVTLMVRGNDTAAEIPEIQELNFSYIESGIASSFLCNSNENDTSGVLTTIFIGNPGVGKSTLLNAIACQGCEKIGTEPLSSISLGWSLTTVKDQLRQGIYGLTDTAEEIHRALCTGVRFRFIFVVTTLKNSFPLAFQPEDVTVMSLVLDALPMIGSNYSIILNKLSPEELATLQIKPIENELQSGLRPTKHIFHLGLLDKNKLHDAASMPRSLWEFIDRAAIVRIEIGTVASLRNKLQVLPVHAITPPTSPPVPRAPPSPPVLPVFSQSSPHSYRLTVNLTSRAENEPSREDDSIGRELDPNFTICVCCRCEDRPVVSCARVIPCCSNCGSDTVVLRNEFDFQATCFACAVPHSRAVHLARCKNQIRDAVKKSHPWRYNRDQNVCHSTLVLSQLLFDNAGKKAKCAICLSPEPVLISFPQPCLHFVCPSCFASTWTERIQQRRLPWNVEKQCVGITCPAGCQVFVHDIQILQLLGPKYYNIFMDLASKSASANMGICGINCAVPTCSRFIIPNTFDHNFVQCPTCKKYTCVVCQEQAEDCICHGVDLAKYHGTAEGHWCRAITIPVRFRSHPLLIRGPRNITVYIHDDDTPTILKCLIEKQTNIPCFKQKLIFPGRKISAHEELCHYNSIPLADSDPSVSQSKPASTIATVITLQTTLPTRQTTPGPEATLSPSLSGKTCPCCHTPIVHFKYHGCHHISPNGGCPSCGCHFCYNCRGRHPCSRCPLWCNESCTCPPCDKCKPNKPCKFCDGCNVCEPTHLTTVSPSDQVSPVQQWATSTWSALFKTASIGSWDKFYQKEILPVSTRKWLCELVSMDGDKIKQKDWTTLCEYLMHPSTDGPYWDQEVIEDWRKVWFHGLLEHQHSVTSLRTATVPSCFVRCSSIGAPVYTVVASPEAHQQAFPAKPFVPYGTRIARRWPESPTVWLYDPQYGPPHAVAVSDNNFGWYPLERGLPRFYYNTLDQLCAHLSCVLDRLLWGRLNYTHQPGDQLTALDEQKEYHHQVRASFVVRKCS